MRPASLHPQHEGHSARTAHDFRQTCICLNDFLDTAHRPWRFPEERLIQWHRQIENAVHSHVDLYWLSLARLAEAAVLTAGAYADQADYQRTGDLLVNPRRINVHYLDTARVVPKKRHMPLSEQFASSEISPREALHDLAQEAMIYIEEDALLPTLHQHLQGCDLLPSAYLQSLGQRMERLAEALNFLACDGIFCSDDLERRLSSLSSKQRTWYQANLCNFDSGWFWQFGRAITQILEDGSVPLQSLLPALDRHMLVPN